MRANGASNSGPAVHIGEQAHIELVEMCQSRDLLLKDLVERMIKREYRAWKKLGELPQLLWACMDGDRVVEFSEKEAFARGHAERMNRALGEERHQVVPYARVRYGR